MDLEIDERHLAQASDGLWAAGARRRSARSCQSTGCTDSPRRDAEKMILHRSPKIGCTLNSSRSAWGHNVEANLDDNEAMQAAMVNDWCDWDALAYACGRAHGLRRIRHVFTAGVRGMVSVTI